MEIPTIDFGELDGENRSKILALLQDACEKWGCFQIENHGIDKVLMEKVENYVNSHYEKNMKASFYESEIANRLSTGCASDVDWETTFFVSHYPKSNIAEIPNLSEDLCNALEEYIAQLIKLAEKLLELMWRYWSNGWYKSVLHRVMPKKTGNRLSIATFYNPATDAIISPAPKVLHPDQFTFGDYLKLYATIKFLEKDLRFEIGILEEDD
ncbi:hypothetical protein MLD38_014293 [Melastoma candidum]|uniref:Uncharacterized protein n=1 Tax=Melastoma candidum TaxID=119954 RepID=A0ACB9RCD8_9MYRT|nr:hypothetical protein MLD38_014293 [Melastoma candidum]